MRLCPLYQLTALCQETFSPIDWTHAVLIVPYQQVLDRIPHHRSHINSLIVARATRKRMG